MLRAGLLGLQESSPEPLPAGWRGALALFAFATWIYRFVLFLGIAVVVYHAFFKALGVALFFVEIGVFIVRPVAAELRAWYARRREVRKSRRRAALLILIAVVAVLIVPWSSRITAPGVLRAGVEQAVFSPFGARVVSLDVANGTRVDAGQVLMTLDAPVQQTERDKAAEMAAAYRRTAQGAIDIQDAGPAQAVLAEQQAMRYERERRARQAELQRLQVVASVGGTVRDVDPSIGPGVWVGPAQRLAMVVDQGRWRVEALVPERDRSRIADGASVAVYVKGRPGRLTGQVTVIDGTPIKRLPHAMLAKSHGGDVPLNPSAPAKDLKPAAAWFRVVAEGQMPSDGSVTPGETPASLQAAGMRQSLWQRWSDAAFGALVQQSGF